MPEPILSIKDLTVEFDTEDGVVHAVTGVSYDVGKGEVVGFWARARELSGGTVRTELIEVLGGDAFGIALVRVFAEREGRSLGGQFQAFTYRIEDGKVAEFWFMVQDRYAVDAFWS